MIMIKCMPVSKNNETSCLPGGYNDFTLFTNKRFVQIREQWDDSPVVGKTSSSRRQESFLWDAGWLFSGGTKKKTRYESVEPLPAMGDHNIMFENPRLTRGTRYLPAIWMGDHMST